MLRLHEHATGIRSDENSGLGSYQRPFASLPKQPKQEFGQAGSQLWRSAHATPSFQLPTSGMPAWCSAHPSRCIPARSQRRLPHHCRTLPVVAPPAGLQRRGLGAPPPPPPPASADASEAAATAAAESLRLAVALLRERCAVGLAPRERLRSLLVQWLALRDFTFNQLQDLL